MFYIAILLILLGLFSLVVLVISLSGQNSPHSDHANEDSARKMDEEEMKSERKDRIEKTAPPLEPETAREPEQVETEKDTETRTEMNRPAVPPPEPPAPPLSAPSRKTVPGEQTVRLKQALQLLEDRNRERRPVNEPQKKSEQLIVTGILFLDHGRQIQYRAGSMPENPDTFFAEMKRVDQGSMVIQGPRFQIICGNVSYQYSASELEQILFVPGGIALVPLSQKRPVPVFLTEDMDRVRFYVERNSVGAS